MTGDVVARRESDLRWRLPSTAWPVLRVLLLLAWVSWAALSWWGAPRTADVGRLDDDLAAGRVTSAQWGDRWDTGGNDWGYRATLESSSDRGPIVAWRTTDGRLHYTDTTRDPQIADGTADQTQLVADLQQAITAAGPVSDSVDGDGPARLVTVISGVVALVAAALLVTGPTPVVGTRWYWWWIFVGMPFGLGLLYWLARERPWSRTAEVPLGPLNGDPRRRWYLGILAGLLTSIGLGMVTVFLHWMFGDGLVPSP